MRMMALMAMLAALSAGAAEAAFRVSLKALSADAARAILSYDFDWVEVDLHSGATRLLEPRDGCYWSSAAYEPDGERLALTAHCGQVLGCEQVRTGLWVAGADGPPAPVREAEGRRWGHALWRREGDVVVTETLLKERLSTRLDQLGSREERCAAAPGAFVSVAPDGGRAAHLDLLPAGWAAEALLGGADGDMVANVRVRSRAGGGTSAEAAAAAICEDPAGDRRAPICGREGMTLRLIWEDGDWRFADTEDESWRRALWSADLSLIGRERCGGVTVDRRLRISCGIEFRRGDETWTLAAPERIFGDIALSGDGTQLAALVAIPGLAVRRFDLFDAETGEGRSLDHLLDLAPPWGAAR